MQTTICALVPAAVQDDSVGLQADQLVLDSNIMKPSGFGIHDEGVRQPQLVHEAAVQSQRLVGVVVGQAVIVPALPQEYGHGVFLPAATHTSKHTNIQAESWADKQILRKMKQPFFRRLKRTS